MANEKYGVVTSLPAAKVGAEQPLHHNSSSRDTVTRIECPLCGLPVTLPPVGERPGQIRCSSCGTAAFEE